MIPSIDRLQERNWVGICYFDVVDVRDVESMADEVDGNVASVTLKAGKTWSRIYLEDEGGTFRDRWVHANGDVTSVAELGGAIAKDRLALMPLLWRLKHRRFLVLIANRNGDTLLMGSIKAPCQMRVSDRKSGDGDKAETDRNELRLSSTLRRRLPIPYYGGVPPTPGTGCPTLQQQMALVTAATIAGYLDSTQASDMLTLMVSGGSDADVYAALSQAQIDYIAEEEGLFATLCAAIDANVPLTVMTTSDAGASAVNATDWQLNGTQDGVDKYINGAGVECYRSVGVWWFVAGASIYYSSTSTGDAAPWDVPSWNIHGAGSSPTPTVAEGGYDVSALIACLNSAQQDAVVTALGGSGGTVQIVITLADGSTENGPLVNAGDPYTLPRIEVHRTGGGALWYKDGDDPSVEIPPMRIIGLNAAGTGVVQINRNVIDGQEGVRIDHSLPVPDDINLLPRFTVYTTDGVTPVRQGDIANPNVSLQQASIRYRDANNDSQLLAASNTLLDTDLLVPSTQVSRRELKDANGNGIGIYVSLDRLVADTIPNLPRVPLKFLLDAGDAQNLGDHAEGYTITAAEAGTYNTYTQDGSSGTLEYSKNGGAFASLTGTITLAVGDRIRVDRSVTTSFGWIQFDYV